jgi:regulator of protease activity HflC (stomatin/prohibitin superfamily)
VRLPQQLQRAMAAEAEAAREARAKVIAAEGEHKSSRALAHAAEIINQSPAALQLRYLQTLNSISAEKNSTIVFPVPIDIISRLLYPPEPKKEEEAPRRQKAKKATKTIKATKAKKPVVVEVEEVEEVDEVDEVEEVEDDQSDDDQSDE